MVEDREDDALKQNKEELNSSPKSSKDSALSEKNETNTRIIKSTVKVDTDRIDAVMDLVGELVVIKSQLLQEVRERDENSSHLASLTDQLDGMVRDLYDRSLSMRMTSLKPIFVKVQRILRDLSVRLDKPIHLNVSGESTEIDRTMIETLTDPLIHIARNAIDHGIESKDERASSGKHEKASIDFNAYQEGGNVIIEFVDDGGGIDPEKVKRKAVTNGIISEEQAAGLANEEAIYLIFSPGFSTAAQVSDISGRGVGLDVVKSNLKKIKGNIDLQSELGKGTRFKISIPLTTAIIDGMILVNNGIRYILPISNIKELIQFDNLQITQTSEKNSVIFNREKFIPTIELDEILQFHSDNLNIDLHKEKNDLSKKTIVVLESGTEEMALAVDKVIGQGQFVIKSLGESFDHIQGIAGGSIMGDGKISLIIDIHGLQQKYAHNLSLDSKPNHLVDPSSLEAV